MFKEKNEICVISTATNSNVAERESKYPTIGCKSAHTLHNKPKQYTGLCLSSGGIRGLIQLGALHEFWNRGYLTNLQYYAGSSVGSVISLLLAIGYEPIYIL